MQRNCIDGYCSTNYENSQIVFNNNIQKNVCKSGLSLRTRTKSENGILCRDNDCASIIEMKHNSKLNDCQMVVDNEVAQHVRVRPSKRHICNPDSESQDMVVTAIYNYSPSQEDELTLFPGDKVRVLSDDFRDSGTEGWWVGLRDSQIGVFPASYVHTDSLSEIINKDLNKNNVPQVTPRTPNECFKIPFSQDCFIDIPCEKICSSNSNGYLLSSSNGVRMISSSEINKMECLGSGSFGVVYHGRWHDKEVAVKTFSVFANEVHIYQEAGHLSCLLHPNIVRLFGVSIINDMGNQIALIMEYARGGALHNFLHCRQNVKLSPSTLLLMSKQIASGMKYLHRDAGICHRDLKSSNVLIKEAIPESPTDIQIANCTLLITDFGMARRTAELVSQQSKLGTLAYAAPEVCKQQGGFSVKSDVWSYGVLLWELLTIDIPYRNVEQPHLLYRIAIKNHTLHIPSGIPSLLVNLLTSCWNEERDLRPEFEEVNQVLNRAQKCKFMEICAEEFSTIQESWREEIRLSENVTDDSMTSSDTERDEFLEQQREIAYAKEELQRREEDMLRREAACSQAMGTVNQFKLLFSVLVAHQIPRISQCDDQTSTSPSPPVPPPRKRPFVGRLKFWGHTNACNNSNNGQHCQDQMNNFVADENCGNPHISAPSNVQHVVHISQQDFNLASPALRFFPDSMKNHTWGPKSHAKSIFKASEETNRDILTTHKPLSFDESISQMDYNDSAGSPSPCMETPNSVCENSIQAELNMCSSAPNLRKISLNHLPVLGFSSFRRPFNDQPVESDTDHGQKIPCERCTRKNTNKAATIGHSIATAHSPTTTWSCIPKWLPEHSSNRFESNIKKKSVSMINTESLRKKKTKCKSHSKNKNGQFNGAMWSIMRMLSAVVLPDRSAEQMSHLTDEHIAQDLLHTLDIPKKVDTFRESYSPTLSLDITTEDEDHSSTGINDSLFQASFYNNKSTPITPLQTQSITNAETIKSAFNKFKASSLPKTSTPKSYDHNLSKPSQKSDRHCKFKNIFSILSSKGRGQSSALSFDLGDSANTSRNVNYFSSLSSWLPFATSEVDLQNGSHQ